MITQRAAGILSATIVLLLSAEPGHAAFVTYQATGTIDQADNTAQLPGALSAATVGQALSIDFTVNTQTAGTSIGPGADAYLSSVVWATASVGSGTAALGVDSSEIDVVNNYFDGSNYNTEYSLTSNSNIPVNFTGTATTFELLTGASGAQPLNIYKNTSLSNAPIKASMANAVDGLFIITSSYIDGIYQSTSDVFADSNVSISRVTAPEIDPGSTISALTLLMGGLAVLCGRRTIKVQS